MVIENHGFDSISEKFEKQRHFFDDGNTRSYKFRKNALVRLKASILKHKQDILAAMYNDSRKPAMEAYIGDIGVVLEEIKFTISNLRSWMTDDQVSTPLTIQPASSRVINEPRGLVMIFAPWNYPFNLAFTPLIGAVAAGNCVLLKPAHETPHTALLIEKIIAEVFQPEHVSVVMGEGKTIGQLLLENFTFNHIFFTGSAATGSWIMEKAARTLTPVTLELGGKCPAIIDDTARLETAATRIVWAKYFNAGQTCLSTDYIMVHSAVADKFIALVKEKIKQFYGDDIKTSPYYARIIHKARLEKLITYLKQGELLYGGNYDSEELYMEPSVIAVKDLNQSIMKEEIFGPIMPVITWDSKDELISVIRKNRYPLACYIFSEDNKFINFITEKIEFGGGCINDAIAQYGNSNFPFGGVMNSGIGKYHGKYSFQTFSNAKPIYDSVSRLDLHIWYPPYKDWKLNVIEKVVG
jgi:aldehyde dehydrogenase (NAD+)